MDGVFYVLFCGVELYVLVYGKCEYFVIHMWHDYVHHMAVLNMLRSD